MNINNISILSDAVLDLEQGKDFYELQQTGIGDYFLGLFVIRYLIPCCIFGHSSKARWFLQNAV